MSKTEKQDLLAHQFMLQSNGAAKVMREALNANCRKATAYMSEKMVITVSSRYKRDARTKRHEFVVKIGAPNFAERRFIRIAKKEGCALPLDQIQVKSWPKK